MESQNEFKILLSRLDDILSLAREGLLKSERYYGDKYTIEDRLRELAPTLGERSQLAIEKNIPQWRLEPKRGMFMQAENVVNDSLSLRTLLHELSEKFSDKLVDVKPETVIEAGNPHNGRIYLRTIFENAINDLFLKDSYIRPRILDILSEYLLDKPNLRIRILVGDNERLPSFRASYETFASQYPNRIEARIIADHPRYILVDGEILFNPDHSFDQWGVKTVNVHQMTDPVEIKKIKEKLEKDWSSRMPILGPLRMC